MNRSLYLGLCVILFSIHASAVFAQQIAPNVKRILFLGNSITWAGIYVNNLEAYITAQDPSRKIEFINAGLSSETVSGLSEEGHAGGSFPRPDLHERLERVLAKTKPDLVFACYGINDGIYKPFDESRFTKFKEGIKWLHQKVEKTGTRIIHLTPPDYDEQKGKSLGYSAVLDRYSDWLLSQKSSSNWEVIDVHYPMQKYLRAHREV
ncbi:MAG: SGNH/GDSL hydrolase family protein, partial [Bacteroidota bacterium]|nr:SGNH/GDSL hydrolase family protein [Bacteroidota bacterium]